MPYTHICGMKNSFTIVLIVFANLLNAQEAVKPSFFKRHTNVDLALSLGRAQSSIAISFNKYHPVFRNGNFKIGYGLRWTHYQSATKDYKTAPAILTSGVNNPSALFRENLVNNIDTIIVRSPSVNYLNAVINLQYTFFKKLDIEFSIDVIGLTFGKQQSATYSSSKWNPADGLIPANIEAKPTAFNLLLISDNDLGSLYSEILARFHINKHISVKAGGSFQFIEYTTNKKLRLDNDRFRYKSFLPMVGVSYWF
jgi:hypothetical protein